MSWLRSRDDVEPELECLSAVEKAFDGFAPSLLYHETAIQNFGCKRGGSKHWEMQLDDNQLDGHLKSLASARDTWNFYFINKFLVKDRNTPVPRDSNKLRISRASFEQLVQYCNIPTPFVHSLCLHFLPHGRGYHEVLSASGSNGYGHWYLLPVRVQVRCTDKQSGHVASASNTNQMNPFNYLHLPDAEVDIRGSCIAIYSGHSVLSGNSTFVVFNLLDGRWAKVVEEPQVRIAETINHSNKTGRVLSPYFPHLVYFTSVSRWWTNAMSSVNDQLIAYDETLQQEMDSENDSTNFYANLNRALHSIAAHLHRYRSELNSLEATITKISHQLTKMRHIHESTDDANRRIVHALDQTASQVKATNDFSQELEKKLSNILALLFNRMQIANTQAMNVVLRAIQTDTQTSQRLSEEMKKDSLSMKTIAVVTMFFLPGATFAALFSMPFLEDSAWVSSISRIWLWFVFTIPTTTLVFLFYWYYKRQDEKRIVQAKEQEEGAKLEVGQV